MYSTVLNETEIVANVRKARLGGVAINYFGFFYHNFDDNFYFQSCFLVIDVLALSLFKVSYLWK